MTEDKMTKRYYYTDPLAAAWMAKYFQMEFTADSPMHCWSTEIRLPLDEYYIHPDSEHILEPQTGDLVALDLLGDTSAMTLKLGSNFYMEAARSNKCKIIQRNGKAFHWPEVE